MRAFSSALDAVPLALAENSGLSPIETLAEVKSRQINEKDSALGIDCNGLGENGTYFFFSNNILILTRATDMKKQFVYDPLISKRQQYLLATQVRFFVILIGYLNAYPAATACSCSAQDWSVCYYYIVVSILTVNSTYR